MRADAQFLHVDKVSKSFTAAAGHSLQALNAVSLTVADGEFVSILGPSGSGKSTLLRIAGGLLKPDSGQVWFRGSRLDEPDPSIGFVFQSTNLMPWRSVTENVLLPMEIRHGKVDAETQARARDILRMVGLDGFEDAFPKHLSGGMAQRVVLARALIQDLRLLLMDEPFGALDALTRERMNEELLRVHAYQEMAVVMVTHSIAEAVLMADRVVILTERPGRIVTSFDIDLGRPRGADLMGSAPFAALTARVRAAVGLGTRAGLLQD